MTIHSAIENALNQSITFEASVSGGCINNATRATLSDGRTVFVKTNTADYGNMFSAEAAGLSALRRTGGECLVPEVIAFSDTPAFLVLEWIDVGTKGKGSGSSAALGRGLAAQHRVTREQFGFDAGNNFIGSTPQLNIDEQDWAVFFGEHRLGFQQALLRRRGGLNVVLDRALDAIRGRLAELLLCDESPSLLHGDLWGGNKLFDNQGRPWLIDPAVYYGHREADLAMTELFGGFSSTFYDAYNECYPLAPGYTERRDIYNLYHVLNHANLFGGSYVVQAQRIVEKYV